MDAGRRTGCGTRLDTGAGTAGAVIGARSGRGCAGTSGIVSAGATVAGDSKAGRWRAPVRRASRRAAISVPEGCAYS
ncbi:hypothetical protein AB0B56_17975 [Streptosporangium canum]|uniref:hypothetical protein n=1 Tax=Streptosporangium canum TaxID=324952 RepID=UPI0034212949